MVELWLKREESALLAEYAWQKLGRKARAGKRATLGVSRTSPGDAWIKDSHARVVHIAVARVV